jgi:hypothetical protein
MMNLKNLKVVRELGNLSEKLKWSMSMFSDAKCDAEYFDLICGDKENSVEATELYLEKMVKEELIRSFGMGITKSSSFDMIVDTVLFNFKKKQLEEMDALDA